MFRRALKKPHEQRSLFGELLDWMLAPLLLLWPMSAALTWGMAQTIASQPFDHDLAARARGLAREIALERSSAAGGAAGVGATHPAGSAVTLSLSPNTIDRLRTDLDVDTYYQVLGLRGELISGERSLPAPPAAQELVLDTVLLRDDVMLGSSVRIAYVWVGSPAHGSTSPPLVQVAETTGKRAQLATEIVKGVIVPQFVILPLAVVLVWLALARGMAPVNELQQRIRSRQSSDLSPIRESDAPEELTPLVRAINDLLARLDLSMQSQKRFLADAAHQLKTPLAGLRTQAELAQREMDVGAGDLQSVRGTLQQIARSSQSAAHMVNQLLSMARAEDKGHAPPMSRVNLSRLATETVRDFVPRALEKRIDLGYEGPGAFLGEGAPGLAVMGRPLLLRELIRNLVDNALQYTPPGGTVTVRVSEDALGQTVILQVEDSGPGIPAAEREQVFEPFYRALGTHVDGSGLGLAIVREIANQHQAAISLEDANLRPQPTSDESVRASAEDGSVSGSVAGPGAGARFTLRFAAVASPEATGTGLPAEPG